MGGTGAWAQKSPAKPRSPIAAAQAQLASGDLQGAESTLWTVLSSNPNHEEALTLLGIVRGHQHRYAEAETLFRKVLQLNSKSVAGHRHLATALVAQYKVNEAIEQYRQAANLAPKDTGLKLELAGLYVEKSEFAAALSTLDEIPNSQFPVDGIPIKAACLIAVGRASEAVRLVPQAKNSPPNLLSLAEVFLRGNFPDKALECLSLAAARLKRPPARLFYLKGRALGAAGQMAAALRSFQQALALDPNSADTLVAIAEIHALQGRHADSVTVLQRARALDPDSIPILRHLVVEGMQAGQRNVILQAAQELREKSPDNPEDLYLVGAVMLQAMEPAAAASALQKYVVQRSEDPKGWMALGMAYVAQRQDAEARKALEKAVQLDPRLAEAEYQLGLVARSEGKPLEAVQHFERALQLQPQHAKAMGSLGSLLLQTGDLEKAQEVLRRSEAADPNNPETQYALALVLSKMGKTEEARQHMQRFQKMNPNQSPISRAKAGQQSQEEMPEKPKME